jgi:hypothetical protein
MSDAMTRLWRDRAQNALVWRSIGHPKDTTVSRPEPRQLLSKAGGQWGHRAKLRREPLHLPDHAQQTEVTGYGAPADRSSRGMALDICRHRQ